MRRLACGRSLAVLLLVTVGREARADDVPFDRQGLILARALAYDNNLKARAGGTLVLAALYRPGNAASQSMADAVVSGFKGLENVRVQELPVKVVRLAYSGPAALKSAIAADGIDGLYVCAGLESDQAAIREVTRKEKTLTVGSREDGVQGGLSIGVFMLDSRSTIVVNLPASKEEGAAFGSELLRLAKVIR